MKQRWFFFFESLCFFSDSVDVGNLISDFSAFSKSSLYIWKFLFHILLSPSLKDFEHYPALIWNECSCTVVWAYFGVAFLWDWNENWPFPVPWPLLSFHIYWHIECSTSTASSFRTLNTWAGIPPPPLALFVVMLSVSVSLPYKLLPYKCYISNIFLNSIYMCQYAISVFFFLTSLCTTGSSTSLELTQIRSFIWLIVHCLYVPQLLYAFICRWTSRLLPCPGFCK